MSLRLSDLYQICQHGYSLEVGLEEVLVEDIPLSTITFTLTHATYVPILIVFAPFGLRYFEMWYGQDRVIKSSSFDDILNQITSSLLCEEMPLAVAMVDTEAGAA